MLIIKIYIVDKSNLIELLMIGNYKKQFKFDLIFLIKFMFLSIFNYVLLYSHKECWENWLRSLKMRKKSSRIYFFKNIFVNDQFSHFRLFTKSWKVKVDFQPWESFLMDLRYCHSLTFYSTIKILFKFIGLNF